MQAPPSALGNGQPIAMNPAMVQGCPPGHVPVVVQGRIVLVPMANIQGFMGTAGGGAGQPQLVAVQPGAGGAAGAPGAATTTAAQLQQLQQLQMRQQQAQLLAAQQRHAQGALGAVQVTGMLPRTGLGGPSGSGSLGGPVVRTVGLPSEPPPPPRMGFTQEQLSCLRNQILAFKTLKRNVFKLEPEVLSQIRPLPLPAPKLPTPALPLQPLARPVQQQQVKQVAAPVLQVGGGGGAVLRRKCACDGRQRRMRRAQAARARMALFCGMQLGCCCLCCCPCCCLCCCQLCRV